MPDERQTKSAPPAPTNRENDRTLQDLLRRSIRQESKITQMMAFIGMKSDGRSPIQPGRGQT